MSLLHLIIIKVVQATELKYLALHSRNCTDDRKVVFFFFSVWYRGITPIAIRSLYVIKKAMNVAKNLLLANRLLQHTGRLYRERTSTNSLKTMPW